LNSDVDLHLELSNDLTSFLASGADFAIRVGTQESSELSQIKLGEIQTLLVASPYYASKVSEKLTSPDELSHCQLIISNPMSKWQLQCKSSNKKIEVNQNSAKIITNELGVSKRFAIDGFGVALLPITEVQEDLNNGKLVNVLPTWQGLKREAFAIWYQRQLLTNRSSMLIDHLKNNCKDALLCR